MKTLKDFQFFGKKVILRVDFNVPISKKGEIKDDFRIRASLPTIEYLREKGARIILISHLEVNKEPISLKILVPKLKEFLGKNIKFFPEIIGEEVKKQINLLPRGGILILENLRFHPGEKSKDIQFAKELSELGDIYINDAFSCCHRDHASISLLPTFLDSGAGILLEKEIKTLSKIIQNPERPLVAIIGGIKTESKLPTILNFLEKADHLILGSKPGEEILAKKSILLGREIPESDLFDRFNLTDPKLHLPIDCRISLKNFSLGYFRVGGIGTLKKDEEIYDIGPETEKIFASIISFAKTIFWSGPMGMFEEKRFAQGTKAIAEAIVKNHLAFKVAGGGDTILAISEIGLKDKFDFLSTGGGAMLEFLAGKKLPGLLALEKK
jgi:phosphoglycerate kinase